ncbi:hypothetical protein ACETRX_04130 [Labrys portucalensis]|uniref:Uncharacterized protein n=1 Tax=Labrys neptuniae TaxID=376174 RepID=A0ABV6Z9B4_9HYPH
MSLFKNNVAALITEMSQAGTNTLQDQLNGKWTGVSGQVATVSPVNMVKTRPVIAATARTRVPLLKPKAILLDP